MHHTHTIPRAQAHSLLDRVLDLAEHGAIGRSSGSVVATLYSQRDGERPFATGRAKYRRVWRRAVDAGDHEARREGRSLIMSAACWTRHCGSIPSRRRTLPAAAVVQSTLDALIAASGARRT
jgi:hypothetical protein